MESAKKNLKLVETHTDKRRLEQKDTTAADSANQGILSRETADQNSGASRQSQFEKPDSAIKVGKTQLINKLNYINFT